MHIALTPEQEKLRAELREYFEALVTPERRAGLAASTSAFGTTPGASSATPTSTRKSSARSATTAGWASAGRRSTAARTAR